MRAFKSVVHRSIPLAFFVMFLQLCTIVRADPPDVRTISTTGEAVVYVVPDQVVLSFGIETFNADLDKAKSANDDASHRLVPAIKALGVEEKYIAADRMSIAIQYNQQNHPLTIDGYTIRRNYTITLKDIKLADKLVDAVLKNGANRMYGLDFQTTELRKYRDQARTMAIRAAKEKAVALAGELDCKVGKPRSIEEGSNGYVMGNNVTFQNASVEAPPGAEDESGTTLPPGQIEVRATVSVTFDLL